MVTREDLVEQSVTEHVRDALAARGYTDAHYELSDSFPGTQTGGLEKNRIALGFNLDNEGEQAELGSDLMRRVYTYEFFVFGTTRTWAKNLANVVKFALEEEGTVALLDITQADLPEIDRLVVLGASADRQIVPDPEPWQEYVWLVTANIEDTYRAALA